MHKFHLVSQFTIFATLLYAPIAWGQRANAPVAAGAATPADLTGELTAIKDLVKEVDDSAKELGQRIANYCNAAANSKEYAVKAEEVLKRAEDLPSDVEPAAKESALDEVTKAENRKNAALAVLQSAKKSLSDECEKKTPAELNGLRQKIKEKLKDEDTAKKNGGHTPAPTSGKTTPRCVIPKRAEKKTEAFLPVSWQAFSVLPLLTQLKPAKAPADFTSSLTAPNLETTDSSADTTVNDYRFDASAQFLIPTFKLNGQEVGETGVIIYEGMQFKTYANGKYEVHAVLRTPPMPVTINLQLLFKDSGPSGRTYTLTLPPVTIPAGEAGTFGTIIPKVNTELRTFHHEGYSAVLESCCGPLCDIRRQGSARFGYGVDVP